MKIKIDKSFDKDQRKIRDRNTLLEIIKVIEEVKLVVSINQVQGIKKLKGHKNQYRIKIGNFRIGIIVNTGVVEFIRVLDRKEIYRYFP